MKVCRVCCVEKPLDAFYVRDKATGRLRNDCKECQQARNIEWHKANPEARKVHRAAWEDKNPGHVNKRKALYRQRNPVGYRKWELENPERKKQLNADWAARNKPRRAEQAQQRRASVLQATPAWADRDLMTDFYYEAEYFGLQVDHIVPLRSKLVCGLHWEGNMQLLTEAANKSKSNRHWPDMP